MEPYTPPHLQKGDHCLWFTDGDQSDKNGHVAICIQVAGPTADFLVFEHGRVRLKDNVRHGTDPWLKNHEKFRKQQGTWDYSPFYKRVLELEAAFSDMKKSKGK